MASNFPSEETQWAVIRGGYNSALISILLTGIYTCIYLGTMYIYLTSKTSRSLFVISALTGLFAFNIVQTGAQWVILTKLLGLIGEPLIVSFAFVGGLTPWITTLNDVMLMLTSTLADALLIWRCYHVWDRSLKVIAFPSLLLVAEFALYMVLCVNGNIQSVSARSINARVSGAASFLTFATTLICTVLIIYRIFSASHKEGPFRNRKVFSGIVELLLQSAAVYAATAFVFAVAQLLVSNTEFHEQSWVLAAYAYSLYTAFAGMIPTIMVARIAMAANSTTTERTTAHISDLEFGGGARSTGISHTGRGTVETGHVHVIDVTSIPSGQETEKSEQQSSI